MGNYVNLLDIVYPVNSIYISSSDMSPANVFGGTWEEKTSYMVPLRKQAGVTHSLPYYTIGDLTFISGFSNIELNNYNGWASSTTKSFDLTNIIKRPTDININASLGVFGFSQNNNNLIWYSGGKSYDNKNAETTNSWQGVIGFGRAANPAIANIHFWRRTA